MRVGLDIRRVEEPEARGWTVALTLPNETPRRRRLREGPGGWPLPPADEAGFWQDLPCAAACADANGQQLSELYRQVLSGTVQADTVLRYGSYLFALLVGPTWSDLDAAAPAGDAIELQISIPAVEQVMQKLQWEMILRNGHPCGVQENRIIAITRVVAGASQAQQQSMPQQIAACEIDLPLRVLFAFGSRIDQNLRPGAEYVGLIQHLGVARQSGNAGQSVDIKLELLEEASTEGLEAKIAEFAPTVLHIIAHGRWAGSEPQIVLSRRDEPNGELQLDNCSPLRLINAMRGSLGASTAAIPPIVVLNACHSGEPNDFHLPFAAELVQHGVKIALGMSGEVADGACRIFTRAFYQSLIGSQPVPVAVARARRAAMLHYQNYTRSIEWSRPTLFVQQGLELKVTVNRPQQIVAAAAFRYRPALKPEILCDRVAALDAYQRYRNSLRTRDFRRALVFEVSDDNTTVSVPAGKQFQIGKTRLLGEIASLSVFDGFVPCVMRSDGGFQPSSNLLSFAIRLAEVMNDARANFVDTDGKPLIAPHHACSALQLGAYLTGNPLPVPDDPQFPIRKHVIRAAVEEIPVAAQISRSDILDTIRQDVNKLLTDVNAVVNVDDASAAAPTAPFFHTVLAMLDDLHRYEGIAVELLRTLLESGLAGQGGSAGLIFTYCTRAEPRGADVMNFIKDKSAISRVMLQPFQEPVESRLAYTQMLLARQKPLAPTWDRAQRTGIETLFEFLHKDIKGVPSFFDEGEKVIDIMKRMNVLVEADDEAILGQSG